MTGVRFPSPIFLSLINTKMKIKTGDLLVLIDSEHCRFLTLNPHTEQVHLHVLDQFTNDASTSHPIPRDKPGRTFNRSAGRKTAYEQVNPRDLREHQFLANIASKIEEKWKSGGFDRIILVGDPEVLNTLKKAIKPQWISKIFGEINKNYLNTPISDLEKACNHI